MQFENGAKIRHPRHGIGTVKYDDGETVGIRFEHGLEECDKNDIEPIQSIADGDRPAQMPNTPEVMARVQAEAIQSINDTWGIFLCPGSICCPISFGSANGSRSDCRPDGSLPTT